MSGQKEGKREARSAQRCCSVSIEDSEDSEEAEETEETEAEDGSCKPILAKVEEGSSVHPSTPSAMMFRERGVTEKKCTRE